MPSVVALSGRRQLSDQLRSRQIDIHEMANYINNLQDDNNIPLADDDPQGKNDTLLLLLFFFLNCNIEFSISVT